MTLRRRRPRFRICTLFTIYVPLLNIKVPPVPTINETPELIEYSHETAVSERIIVKLLLFVTPIGNTTVGPSGTFVSMVNILLLVVLLELLPKLSVFLT